VEFTVLLPVILIMLSGVVEFGFMLNYYLDLIDTSREVARFTANDDPLHFDASGAWTPYNPGFYARAKAVAENTMMQAGQISLDPAEDDLVISVFVVDGRTVTGRYPPTIVTGCGTTGGSLGLQAYCNFPSKFSDGDIADLLSAANLPNLPPNTGVVLVEIFYTYDMVLALPWITAFVSNPVTLHAYSLMPNTAAEPTPTPP
jgi:hypothetical protein